MSAREQRLRAERYEDAIQRGVFGDPVKLAMLIQHIGRCDECRIAFRTILEHIGKKKTYKLKKGSHVLKCPLVIDMKFKEKKT